MKDYLDKPFPVMLFLCGALIFIVGFGNVWFGPSTLYELGWVLGIIGLLIILGAVLKWPDKPPTKEDVKTS